MWTYTQENGVRLSFTDYYDFLWGKIIQWVMFWNLILLKALYLLRLFATWEEVVKYSEMQEKWKIQVTFAVACASIFYIQACTKF